ncbi:MAG: ComF family protein [Lachnospiraceae bacterium]|nr:ComF family protein [Lachnospiraceae bacterium]
MLWETVVEWLYPRRCPLCGGIALPRGELACPPCKKQQRRLSGAKCFRCGKELEQEEKVYCPDCAARKFSYERGFALWQYDARMKRSIQEFKYKGRQEYADFYVEQLLEEYQRQLWVLELEAVIPVPLYKVRRQERGYNQAELLAAGVAKGLGLPLVTDFLVRSKGTRPQKELGLQERQQNVQKAFSIDLRSRQGENPPARVLLVDDIYTTGSTAEACSKVLRQAGVRSVYLLCLCIGTGA